MAAGVLSMWWTVEQVAEHTGLTVTQVYESRRRREWPGNVGVRQGRSLRFDSELVKAGPREPEHTDDPSVAAVWMLEDVRTLAREIKTAIHEVRASVREEKAVKVMDIEMCGLVRSIDDGPDHWVVACTQDEYHDGPHVGIVAWEDDEERADNE